MIKLSIVIPVYNVERYIEKCLLSCLRQDLSPKQYEIIVVNDGSPDASLSIAERVAKDYLNVTIISQDNQGLSGARNTGLKHAKGEYIWFVDSDDYIEENCLGGIVPYLKDDLDILQLQYRLVYEDETPSLDARFCQIEGIKSGTEVTEQGGLPAPAQFSVLRSNFLKNNNLEFVKGIYHEDSEFKPRATFLAKKITSYNKVVYNYYQRAGSIMSSFRLKNALDMLLVMNNLLQFISSNESDSKYIPSFCNYISTNMNSLLFGFRQLKEPDRQQMFSELQQNKHLFKCMLKSTRVKYKLEGMVFLLNIQLGLNFYKLLK